MRFFTHRVVREVPHPDSWGKIKLKDTIFLNASNEFIEDLQCKYIISSYYSDKYSDYVYEARKDGERGRILISKNDDLEDLEVTIIRNINIADKYIVGGRNSVGFLRTVADKMADCNSLQTTITNRKKQLFQAFTDLNAQKTQMVLLKRKYKELLEKDIVGGVYQVTFNNVTAEDTDAEGDDIYLGTLTFEVNLFNHTVNLVDGDVPQNTSYNSNAYHPHHLSDSICLGTQSPDFIEACENYDIDIIHAILYKFAHSYTSSDSAGESWRIWAGYKYSEWDDYWYHEDEVSYSKYYNDWIINEDAVTVEGYGIMHERDDYVHYSEYDELYYHSNDTVYSGILDSYIHTDNAVQLHNGRYTHKNDEELVEYNGSYFMQVDMVEDINGDTVPDVFTVYSEPLSAYILEEQAVKDENGDYYTAETLPQKENE